MDGVVVAPHRTRAIRASDVIALYAVEGWWPQRTVEQVLGVLAGPPAVGAWRDDELVGFARAVTDGTLRAYVEDVVVSPRLRRTGIGRSLVACLLDELGPVPVVSLFCAQELVPLYRATGFRPTTQVVLHRS